MQSKRSLGNSGLALLQVMMILAAFSITVPVLLNMLAGSSKRYRQRLVKEQYLQFIVSMKNKLEDPTVCSQTLQGIQVKDLKGTYDKSNDELQVKLNNKNFRTTNLKLNIDYGKNKGPIKKGWKHALVDKDGEPVPGQSFEISDIYLVASRDDNYLRLKDPNKPPTPDNLYKVGPYNEDLKLWNSPVLLKAVPIRLFFQSKDFTLGLNMVGTEANSGVAETLPSLNRPDLQISLIANVDSNGRIQSCYGPNSPADFCEAQGGVYDTSKSSDPQLRCKPNECFVSEVVTNPKKCKPPYKTSQVGGFGTNSPQYMCTWCHKHAGKGTK